MSGKTYLITGANRGLGFEFVQQITASSPANKIFACVRSLQGELDDLNKLASKSSNIQVVECDTSSVTSIHSAADKVSKLLGSAKIDYLLNNAGINAVPERTALDATADELRQHFDVNVVGPAEMIKSFDSHLGKGSVVLNMSSGVGSCEKGIERCAAYAVSKAALNMLTCHQSYALRDRGVTVIAMDPGWVQTRMGGEGAVLTPKESIEGMLNVLHFVSIEKSGTFFQYDGETVPW